MATEALIVKIVPSKPIDTVTFRGVLSGLKIEAFDLSIGDATTGTLIGIAEGVLDINDIEITTRTQPTNIRRLDKAIWQHWKPDPFAHPGQPIDTSRVQWYSVASAVLLVNRPTDRLEYGSLDLSLKVTRNDSFSVPSNVEFNASPVVNLDFGPPVAERQLEIFNIPGAAYVFVPTVDLSQFDPNRTAFPDPEGTVKPWDFTTLVNAVNVVLSQDRLSNENADTLKLENRQDPLTIAQSKYIAAEIIWNRVIYSPPQAPSNDSLCDWYTNGNDEPGRNKFEGEYAAYAASQSSQVARLANYVFAASAAIEAERHTKLKSQIGLQFAFRRTVAPSVSSPDAGSHRVALAWLNSTAGFIVPAAFFYALGAQLPAEISRENRYSAATFSNESQNTTALQSAIDSGIIGASASPLTDTSQPPTIINIYQAARRLAALGSYSSSLPLLEISAADDNSPSVISLVNDWLQYTGPTNGLMLEFWDGPSGAIMNHPVAYLVVALCFITSGFKALIDAILHDRPEGLGVKSVALLAAVKETEWKQFFGATPTNGAILRPHPDLLPDFTMPGSIEERTNALLRRIRSFFWLEPESARAGPTLPPKPAPVFEVVDADIVSRFIATYQNVFGNFTFEDPVDENKIESVANSLFPANPAAQSRLGNAIKTINNLTIVTKDTGDIRFSLMESLYARGFISAEYVSRLPLDKFRRALIGTPAFPSAAKIHTNARSITNTSPGSEPSKNFFTPINPDGNLVNCIPPDHLSPLGPVEYLHEVLALPTVYGTLAQAISSRRDNLDNFLASDANLKVELPLIDIVNENLEAIASHVSAPLGQTYNTGDTSLDIARSGMLGALPEHSSPAIQLSSPIAYKKLRQAFDSPHLPYSQTLDVCRSYLNNIGTSRFQVMRTFREDTTEFPIPVPDNQRPDEFEKQRWRLPVDCKAALEYLQISQEEFDMLYSGDPLSVKELQTMLGFDCYSPNRPPSEEPPTEEPPTEEPPTEEPPTEEPPTEEPPTEEPPTEEPPTEEPPGEEPPTATPPVTPPDQPPIVTPPSGSETEPHGCIPSERAAPEWKPNQNYALDDLVRFQGRLYKCRQKHDSLSDWIPTRLPALWVTPVPCGLTQWHVQTEYIVGSFVRYRDRVYKCHQAHTSDSPDWTPANTPALWVVQAPIPASVFALPSITHEGNGAERERGENFSESDWTTAVCRLDRFLSHTDLSYCQFLDVVKSRIVPISRGGNESDLAGYPACEPCCLKSLAVQFDAEDIIPQLRKMVIFIRLWHSLKSAFPGMLQIAELAEICRTLRLFRDSSGKADSGFICQVAALIMSHCYVCIPVHTLLQVYVSEGSPPDCVLNDILTSVENMLVDQKGCRKRAHGFKKILVSNMGALSRLAGFFPPTNWFDCPTNTIRFLEILGRIYESEFSIGEILFMFTPSPHLQGDDPFPMQDQQEAADDPLELAEDSRFSLWELRRKLLHIQLPEGATAEWSWNRILSSLDHLGIIGRDAFQAVAEHFFPSIVGGHDFSGARPPGPFKVPLPGVDPRAWESMTSGPLVYRDGYLYLSLPLRDVELMTQLRLVRALTSIEQDAVQDLYFAPREILSPIAFLFEDFDEALVHLIGEQSHEARWGFFRRQFAKFYARCETVVFHLADHVAHTAYHRSGCEEDGMLSLDILRNIMADENRFVAMGASWEDEGAPSATSADFMWNPKLSGTSFAAILGLLGTGPLEEYRDENQLLWRDLRSSLNFFGNCARNKNNWPIPTVLPSLRVPPSLQNDLTVTVRNGFAIRDTDDLLLGGPARFTVSCRGTLLIEHAGRYEFEGQPPDLDEMIQTCCDGCPQNEWCVTLQRGQKLWTVLQQGCEEYGQPTALVSKRLWLRRGAYEMAVYFKQTKPVFDDEHPEPVHTGLRVHYCGPDTGEKFITIPRQNLFCNKKTARLVNGLVFPVEGTTPASQFLSQRYYSTLRDIRRTYQRAYKALLFCRRNGLSARPAHDSIHHSEIGFLLSHPQNFAGFSYYRMDSSTKFMTHRAGFDLNLIPVVDPYHAPSSVQAADRDVRAYPSPQRQAALFDWFERLAQYSTLRQEHRRLCKNKPLWQMFLEADSDTSMLPDQLLLYLGIDVSVSNLVLTYYTASNRVKRLQASDLIDERWAFRVWRAGCWLGQVRAAFYTTLIETSVPSQWASDDPGEPIEGATLSGNANLIALVSKSLQSPDCKPNYPHGITDLTTMNNGLRVRARSALIDYLCTNHRVSLDAFSTGQAASSALDLNSLLLVDVGCSVYEKTTRVEDLIVVAQTVVQRALLGLEPHITLPQNFTGHWKHRYASFKLWQSWKGQTVYAENWVQWKDLYQAKKSEGFRFLSEEMSRFTHTIPLAAESNYFQPISAQEGPNSCLERIQNQERAVIQGIRSAPDEGLRIMGTPSFSGRPSWVAPLRQSQRERGDEVPVTPSNGTHTAPSYASGLAPDSAIPLWIRAAIRMGTRFVRVPAASLPPGLSLPAQWSMSAQEPCCAKQDNYPLLDEYWFWISDGSKFKDIRERQNADIGSSNPLDSRSDWDDPAQLPKLLQWPDYPTVYLNWTRFRFDQYEPPRCSKEAVEVSLTTSNVPQLLFLKRSDDSLVFAISGTVSRPGYPDGTNGHEVGFRYDIVTDEAVVIPQLEAETDGETPDVDLARSYPAPLTAYPFFVYFCPGSPSIPSSDDSTVIFIAEALRTRCCFEDALQWCEKVYNPLTGKNSWEICPKPSNTSSNLPVFLKTKRSPKRDTPCCPQQSNDPSTIRQRAITLLYLDILLQYCDSNVSKSTKEGFQQALVILDCMERILGPSPRTIQGSDYSAYPQRILSFVSLPAPLNTRLLALYDNVKDRRSQLYDLVAKSHQSTATVEQGLQVNAPGISCLNPDSSQCQRNGNHYRFTYLLPRALEAVEFLRGLGNNLLSALEKGDAEYLSSLRITHENQIQALAIDIRQNTWRESDWQLQSLGKTMENAQTRLRYFQNLVTHGLNNGETTYQNDTTQSTTFRTSSTVSDGIAQGMTSVPDWWIGVAGMAGTPLNFHQIPVGNKMANGFSTAARILNTLAELQTSQAGLSLTEAGWDRRADEWQHTIDTTSIEIEQIKRQLIASKRRCAISLKELNNHERQIEQSREVHDFVRDKFTKQDLYLFLQTETVQLFQQAHELAASATRDALRAFLYERGDYGHSSPWADNLISPILSTTLKGDGWESLREGLTVGDRLELALRALSQKYTQRNAREYELTKHVSLRLLFPLSFLQLKITGRCAITIPEWIFDLDYPGHYMRRIKSVGVTIPCVTGPYTGVHCRLRLLSSSTRVDPSLHAPSKLCCTTAARPGSSCPARNCYTILDAEDPRVLRQYHHSLRPDQQGGFEIATSSGQADTGMFDVNLRSDERYLPFEFCGAADSTWIIDLSQESNQFDLRTLSDAVLHINYTAREGGEALREAASASVAQCLPDQGFLYLDAKEDLSDAWYKCFARQLGHGRHISSHRAATFVEQPHHLPSLTPKPQDHHCHHHSPNTHLKSDKRHFNLAFSRTLFPFVPPSRIPGCNGQIRITRIDIFIDTAPSCSHASSLPECYGCSQPASASGRHIDLFYHPTAHCSSHTDVPCIVRCEWDDSTFHGIMDFNTSNKDTHKGDCESSIPQLPGAYDTANPGQDVNIGDLCFPPNVRLSRRDECGDDGQPGIIVDKIFFIVQYEVVGLGMKPKEGLWACNPTQDNRDRGIF